jgi:phospholipid-binding lipoprotein MlaA
MNKEIIFNFEGWKNFAFSRVNGSVCTIFGALFFAAFLLASPASAASHSSQAAGAEVSNSSDAGEIEDPFEGLNRALFFINDGLDTMFLRPVAVAYTTFIPAPVRKGVDNFMSNVATPVTLSNDILQGEWERAGITTKRFVINSTIGLGGLVDVAADQGLPKHTEDFGQTLAVYGVGSGPYIFVPILGPSTPRHLVGRAVDLLSDPWTYILYHSSILVQLAPKAVVGASFRGRNDVSLNSIKETSADYYSSIKNLYSQSRRNAINNGEVDDNDLVDIPEFESR